MGFLIFLIVVATIAMIIKAKMKKKPLAFTLAGAPVYSNRWFRERQAFDNQRIAVEAAITAGQRPSMAALDWLIAWSFDHPESKILRSPTEWCSFVASLSGFERREIDQASPEDFQIG